MIGTHEVWVYPDRSAPAGEGVDVSCLVDEVTITQGRADATSQPEPASATVDLTIGPGAPLPAGVDVGAWLVITTTLAVDTYTRFTGRITDAGIGWDDAGPDTPDAGIGQIVATSVLADYARAVIGAEPFPQELDGARVARAFAAAGLTLDPALSDPGMVEILPRDIDARAALEVAQEAASSAGGLVWETRDGQIRYADADHRRGADVDLDLDACDLYVTPTWMRNVSGLVNDITIGYGTAPEGGGDAPSYTYRHRESVDRWGRYAYSVGTILAREEDAQEMAHLIATQNSTPVWQLNALPVAVADLDATQTAALLDLEVHALLRVSGMPVAGGTPSAFACWLEGWTERLAWGIHDLELTVTDYCRTVPPPRWNDLDPDVAWDTLDPALTWDDTACVGAPVADLGRWDDVAASTRWDQVDPDTAWDDTTAGVPV